MVPVGSGADEGLAWHMGDPLREQRWLEDGTGVVDLGNREVLRITGADRAAYLNLLGTQKLDELSPGQTASTFLLDPRGHILFFLGLVETGEEIWGWTEPGYGAGLADHLNRMRFRMDVAAEVREDVGVVWSGFQVEGMVARAGAPNCLGGYESFVPRIETDEVMRRGHPAGTWAHTALRIAAGVPRFGADTDGRTLPNELGVPSENLALDKGCYPGQETVARVYNVGAPPRRLVRLHLDGSEERFVDTPAPLTLDGTPVGFMGSMSYHHELGPIGLGLVKRETDDSAALLADGVPARVEPLVPRDAGLHVRFPSNTPVPRMT